MTKKTDPELLAEAASEIGKLRDFVQNGGILELGQASGDKSAADVIFELWGNLSAINHICTRFGVKVENIDGSTLSLPMNPAKKENFPYFVALDENQAPIFQICLGTKVSLGDGDTYAPDLSIQNSYASLDPTGDDIVFCWDFKHKEDQEKRLDRKEILAFATLLNLMQAGGKIGAIPFQDKMIWPDKNAILTNAAATTLSKAALLKLSITEVCELRPHRPPKRRP